MMDGLKTDHDDSYASPSPGYFLDNLLSDTTSQGASPQVMTANAGDLYDPFRGASTQESSSDSQTNSTNTSDDSSGDVLMSNQVNAPALISIPADYAEQQQPPNTERSRPFLQDDPNFGNDFFDFESAASSPTNFNQHLNHNLPKVPIRAAQNNGAPNLGYGPPIGNVRKTHSKQSLSGHIHLSQSSYTQPRFVNGSFPQNSDAFHPHLRQSNPPNSFAQLSQAPKRTPANHTRLRVSELPRTQRVETQMHVKLTMSSLPQGIKNLHFQSFTMARTKLVMKPPPLKDPSMLELYAHCVSATAMEDPQKRQRAFDRAAQSTREDDPCKEIGNPPSRSLEMAENDLNKPSSGGFVYICEQCIRRENKRIARKKLKNEQDEENWRTDQPKRIIVFNKAEVLEWKNVESYKDEETGERSTLVGQSKEELPNNTMQVHCPMRIQCYSRHHGEKVGYRVIFTVKDSDDKLIAQTLSSSVIITDDHKTPQATKIPGEFQSTSSFGSLGSSSAGFYQQLQGPSLDGRNSFSTPDLQSLNLSYRHQHSQSQSSFPSLGDSSLVNPEYPASTNCSRPASPTALPGPQHKRRKGSGNAISRPRPDLTMTKMSSERMKSPPAAGSVPIGLSRPPGSKFPQPLPSHHSSTHGLSTPPTSSHMQASPNLPWPATGNFFPRSQSVENLQSLQDVFSAPSSAWQSQVPSPESSPQSYSQVHVQAQGHRNPSNEPMPGRALPKLPIICKTTPADGPQSGGVEVTCLGEGFRSSSQIFFGDIPATTRSVWSESALVCVLPPAVHPGPVTVTVRQSADPRTPLSSQNPIHFTYVNTDEQDLLKHALHLVHQQFAGSPPPQASDIARGILTSFGVNNSRLGKGTQFPYSQNLQYAAAPYINSESRDVEDLVLKSLEIIDLDDKPNKVNLNFRGMNGQVMLHTSASLSFYRLLAGLLARGAHPDVRDNNGMTPMHIAALHGNLRMVHKLRSSGADPTIRSLNGMRPAEIAGTQEVRATLDDLNLDPSYKRIDRLMTPHLNRVSSNRSGSGILSNTGKVSEVCRGTPSTDDLGFSKARPAPRLQSPLESLGRNTNVVLKPTQEHDLSTDAAVLAASPALSAWRDQISTQIQQLQQSVQRALPLMPALTDYQTHPVMRRISNLVPQRGARVENPDNNTGKLKDGDYRWWELITGPSSPPSYEEIYPHQTRDQQQRNEKEIMALRAAGEAVLDKKCELLHDRPEISANEETFNIGREALTEAQQQQIRKAHAQKVKKLHKDRNLFFIWIPILFIIMLAVLKERMSSIWNSASQAYISLAS